MARWMPVLSLAIILSMVSRSLCVHEEDVEHTSLVPMPTISNRHDKRRRRPRVKRSGSRDYAIASVNIYFEQR